jgi:DNA-binding MarR family transcriptional regulator
LILLNRFPPIGGSGCFFKQLECWKRDLKRSSARVELSPPKYSALNQLVLAGRPLMLGELAARLTCVRSNITQLVDRLEADGWSSGLRTRGIDAAFGPR